MQYESKTIIRVEATIRDKDGNIKDEYVSEVDVNGHADKCRAC